MFKICFLNLNLFIINTINLEEKCDLKTYVQVVVVRYAIVNSVLMDKYGENCLDYEYDKYVQRLRDTRYVDNGEFRTWILIIFMFF